MGEIRPKTVWLFGIFDGYFRQALALKLSRAVEGDADAESLKEQLQYRSGEIKNVQQKLGDRDHQVRFNPI